MNQNDQRLGDDMSFKGSFNNEVLWEVDGDFMTIHSPTLQSYFIGKTVEIWDEPEWIDHTLLLVPCGMIRVSRTLFKWAVNRPPTLSITNLETNEPLLVTSIAFLNWNLGDPTIGNLLFGWVS